MLTSAVLYQVSLIGLDKRFVESELKIVDSLRSGSALLHHLEPSYYAAIRTALDDGGARSLSEASRQS